jgi:2-C-methyl-D-erythritol 2,4-cyclodiphosphate synthase
MLSHVVDLLSQRGYRIGNVDATIVAEQPVLQPHLANMRERLASTMAVAIDNVSIKATTAERLGAIGRGEGLQAQAIARIVGADD